MSTSNQPWAEVTRREHFSAACRYALPGKSPEESAAAFGPKARPHGHNYRLDTTVAGPIDETTGMVINLIDFKALLAEVLDTVDHRNLNDLAALSGQIPTAENLALYLWDQVERRLVSPCRLAALRLAEDEDTWVELRRRPGGGS